MDALGPAPRAELLHVLMLPDFERADRIGEFWGYPESRAFAELDGAPVPLDLARRASRLLVENALLITTSVSGADEIENL